MEKTVKFVYVVVHAKYPLVALTALIAQAHAEAIEEATGEVVKVQKMPIAENEREANGAKTAMFLANALANALAGGL